MAANPKASVYPLISVRPAPTVPSMIAVAFLLALFLVPFRAGAATPGLPFTEDFTNRTLMDSSKTSAEWFGLKGQVELPEWKRVYGTFSFSTIGTTEYGSTSFTHDAILADLDGDGDLDAVFANDGTEDRIYLNNGNGWFSSSADLSAETRSTMMLAAGDVDNDGDLDLVTSSLLDTEPNLLYLNNGDATFAAGTDPFDGDTPYFFTEQIVLADMNGDGNLDLLTANEEAANRIYLGNGDGTFQAGYDFSDVAYDTHGLAVGDLDGDGDLDIVTGNYAVVSVNQEDRYYLNNGDGTFAAGVNVTADVYNTYSVSLGDVDGDGDLDLLASTTSFDRLYLNNGTAAPFSGATGVDVGPGRWHHKTLLADADNDGDLDYFTVDTSGGANKFFLNDGRGNFDMGTDIFPSLHNSYALAVGDLNGDGVVDAVVGNNLVVNEVHINGATENPFQDVSPADVTADADATWTVALEDVDLDGDLDLMVGNLNQQDKLYLNDGSGDLSSLAYSTFEAAGTISFAFGDVNSDGYPDMIAGNNITNLLYVNNGSGGFPLSGAAIGSESESTNSVALADMDSDGDLDLVVGNYNNTSNRLYLNNGAGGFSASGAPIGTETESTTALVAGDVDSDGDLDLVAGNYQQPNRLYLNNGSGGFPSLGTIIGSENDDTLEVHLADLDSDGDLDLVSVNRFGTNKIYFNDGSGGFSVVGTDVSNDNDQTYSLTPVDLDRDGDLDLVAANNGQENKVYFNDGAANFSASGFALDTVAGATGFAVVGDLDRNGYPDIVAGNNGETNQLYLNLGGLAPHISAVGEPISSDTLNTLSLVAGDLDGDGDIDLIGGNSPGGGEPGIGYYENDGSGGFPSTQTLLASEMDATWVMELGDLDNDGDLDLVAGKGTDDTRVVNKIYLNDGTGDFPTSGADLGTELGGKTNDLALGDLDKDGYLDIVVANNTYGGTTVVTGELLYYMNDGAGGLRNGGDKPDFGGYSGGVPRGHRQGRLP